MGKYIALQAIQYVDANGLRKTIEPKSAKHSGLFEHEFDAKTEKRLFSVGAIREPEDLEVHADATSVETMDDSRDIDGEATEVAPKKGSGKNAPKKTAGGDADDVDLGV